MIDKQNKIVNKNNTYKQTSIGLIPNDWEVMTLGEVYNYINTPSFSRENLTNEKTENEVYYIHYGDIHSTFKSETLDFEIEKRVPFLKDEFCNANLNYLQDGDLVIADASEDYAGVGESIEIKNIGDRKVVGGLHTLVLRDKEKNTAKGFNTYIFRNQSIHNELKKIATGISVYGISKGNLSKIEIPLPPLPEQKAIAHILGLMDAAINTNNQLIAQKQQRKKWLMQNLLTGKKRLKGFSEEWKEVRLGEIGEVRMCKRIFNNETSEVGEIPFYKIGTFGKEADAYISKTLYEQYRSKYSFPNKGDILISAAGTLGRLVVYDGLPSYFQDSNIVWIENNETKAKNEYLYFAYSIIKYDSEGGTIQRLYNSIIKKAKLPIPSLEEQTAIAQILQAADKEIQLLKVKTDKLKEQKKGLMQMLLTGKKRLKIL